jgi:uncharacterized protein (TIGR02646 family)
MIRVIRGPEPTGFNARASQWIAHFEEAHHRDQNLSVSKFWSSIRAEIRPDAEVLYERFRGKCAFCESRMSHVSSPHIEHYRPKKQFQSLAFSWDNWLLSCGRCNDKKWAHFPDCDGQPCLIDPATEDPEEHIEFERFLILAKTERGQETIRLVGLDRSPLEDERSHWLLHIDALLLLCLNPECRVEARNLLIWCMQDNAPYSAMTRCYLEQRAPKLAHPVLPHPNIDLNEPIHRMEQLLEEYRPFLQDIE